ncbi:MAG: lysine--tRNA ligase [Acidobacteriota bacterium]
MEEELIAQRRQKLENWPESFETALPDCFADTTAVPDLLARYGSSDAETLAGAPVKVRAAGRLVGMRKMGKLAFAHMAERGERIQLLFEKKTLGDAYSLIQLLDVGDWIGVDGALFRTRTNELTIRVHSYVPLQKCLRPLPEKWHGLTDIEQRYRQRYLDLVINPVSVKRFKARHAMIQALREVMLESGYEEVETPMLHYIAGGAAARPFETHHNALDMDLFLRIAPELFLKRLVVGGLTRVFEINRNFRNEGVDTRHNPEFTMMEWYRAFASASDQMDFTEYLLAEVVRRVTGGHEVTYQEKTVSFAPPYERLPLRTGAKKALAERGVPEGVWETERGRKEWAPKLGMSPAKADTPEKFLVEAFDALVAPNLWDPTFVCDYPVEVSPLSRRKPGSNDTTDRFELYIAGMELANGFSELNEAEDQRERFSRQMEAKAGGDEEAMPYDEDYCTALEYGLPPTAGEGLGIDRLAMVLTDTPSIRDVILFPHLKPRTGAL